MRLENVELYRVLKSKGVSYLCHANTVSTVITYIEESGLLSRGEIERRGLHQTPQSSDAIDRRVGVWDDIFLDTIDLHGYFPRQNHYGPVLLKLSIDFLLKEDYEIWITKDNPINWDVSSTDDERYFVSTKELDDDWTKYQRQRKMVTIRNCNQPILLNYVFDALLDDPRRELGTLLLVNESVRALKQALSTNEILKSKFRMRVCSNCFCRSNYLHQVSTERLKQFFLPKELTL